MRKTNALASKRPSELLFGADAQTPLAAIGGTGGDDVIVGTAGDDVIDGGEGNDDLDGAAGNDIVNGDNGDDLLRVSSVGTPDTANGGSGSDTLIINWAGAAAAALTSAGPNVDALGGYSGTFTNGTRSVTYSSIEHFQITTGSGVDEITTGDGDDVVSTGANLDFINVGAGINIVDGGAGDDSISADFSGMAAGVSIDLRNAVNSGAFGSYSNLEVFEEVIGSGFDDAFVSTSLQRRDTLRLGAGDDTATLFMGQDTVHGGTGFDTLVLEWSDGTSAVFTTAAPAPDPDGGFRGTYNDQFNKVASFTSIERFVIRAGSNGDTFITGDGDDFINGGGGNDSLSAAGGNDQLEGAAGNDTLNGGAGDDRIDGGIGADTMTGGADDDVYFVDNAGDVVTELAGEGTDEVRTALGDKTDFALMYTLPDNVENLTGTSAGAQGVIGNALDNLILMGGGNDLVVLDGGGADIVSGAQGNDFFYYGAALTAADSNYGGAGIDTVGLLGTYDLTLGATSLVGVERLAVYSSGDSGAPNEYAIATVDANVAAGQTLTVLGLSLGAGEALTFLGHAETDGAFDIRSGAGDDTLVGGLGNDLIAGGAGDDDVYALNGNDQIGGGAGRDTLYGGGGNDRITGGTGGDLLNGGFGADTMAYASAAESSGLDFDTIHVFDARIDRIDLPGAVSGWTGSVSGGQLSTATFDADLAAALDGVLEANSAALFRPDSGDFAGRTFAVIDADGDGSYQSGTDFVLEFTNPLVPIDTGTSYFV